ncbi:Hemicentin-2, partial [Tinamus guttatus]
TDSGDYSCTASNALGSTSLRFHVDVHEPPVLKPLPGMVMVMVNASAALSCEASGVPPPAITWQKEGVPVPRGHGLEVLPNGRLHIPRASEQDAGIYLCVAQNPSGTASGRTRLIVRAEPRRVRGSLVGIINAQEFGVATLNASVLEDPRAGTADVRSSIQSIPLSLGPLMRVLVAIVAPVYCPMLPWGVVCFAGTPPSPCPIPAGELLHITHTAHGLDGTGALLLDSVISGSVPKRLAEAGVLQLQDFSERYVQTGPGQLHGEAVQSFVQGGRVARARCTHSIAMRGNGCKLKPRQFHLHVRKNFFPVRVPEPWHRLHREGEPAGTGGKFTPFVPTDLDECQMLNQCQHECRNSEGSYRCTCPAGYRL